VLILSGDLGGTKTLLRVNEVGGPGDILDQPPLFEKRYASGEYASFDDLMEDFLQAASREEGLRQVSAACIGVAGPVADGSARVTNLPWVLREEALCQRFSIPRFRLINDFSAIGYGLETLRSSDLLTLQAGEEKAHAPRALIGAGTGLGEGILVWRDGGYDVMPSEGGHVDFAPTDEVQRALLEFLSQRQERVSYENIVSGKGLLTLYHFMAFHEGESPSPSIADPAGVTAAAEAGHELAQKAIRLFVSIYGAQAGNLALTCLAAGGVYVAGGVAPRIQSYMTEGGFMQAFLSKMPMQGLLARFPVYMVLDTSVGLKGAACVAAKMLA
jgi:glucokinase